MFKGTISCFNTQGIYLVYNFTINNYIMIGLEKKLEDLEAKNKSLEEKLKEARERQDRSPVYRDLDNISEYTIDRCE